MQRHTQRDTEKEPQQRSSQRITTPPPSCHIFSGKALQVRQKRLYMGAAEHTTTLLEKRENEDINDNIMRTQTSKHKQLPVQPERAKDPPLTAQVAQAVPEYPEAQLSTQFAAVTVPTHPVVTYPVVPPGRVQVLSSGCVEKQTNWSSPIQH